MKLNLQPKQSNDVYLVIMKEMPAEAVCPTAFTLAAIPPVALSHYGFAKCNFSWMGMV